MPVRLSCVYAVCVRGTVNVCPCASACVSSCLGACSLARSFVVFSCAKKNRKCVCSPRSGDVCGPCLFGDVCGPWLFANVCIGRTTNTYMYETLYCNNTSHSCMYNTRTLSAVPNGFHTFTLSSSVNGFVAKPTPARRRWRRAARFGQLAC